MLIISAAANLNFEQRWIAFFLTLIVISKETWQVSCDIIITTIVSQKGRLEEHWFGVSSKIKQFYGFKNK
jgi:hypothetical protein